MHLSTPHCRAQANCFLTRTSRPIVRFRAHKQVVARTSHQPGVAKFGKRAATLVVRADGDKEELPWERKERLQSLEDKDGKDLPFPVYLLGSAIIAIAAVGSVFEIINKNSIFGVLPPSNPLWLPILGVFAVTGIPSAGLLFFKAIKSANDAAERQNKADGY